MKYADFFDPPDGKTTGKEGSGNDSEGEDENEADEMVAENEEDEEEEFEDDEVVASSSEGEMDSDEEQPKTMSSFEKKQQKVKLTTIYIMISSIHGCSIPKVGGHLINLFHQISFSQISSRMKRVIDIEHCFNL